MFRIQLTVDQDLDQIATEKQLDLKVTYNFVHDINYSLEFYKVLVRFYSPQVKPNLISSVKTLDFPNNLRVKISGNQEISRKLQNFMETQLYAWSPLQN